MYVSWTSIKLLSKIIKGLKGLLFIWVMSVFIKWDITIERLSNCYFKITIINSLMSVLTFLISIVSKTSLVVRLVFYISLDLCNVCFNSRQLPVCSVLQRVVWVEVCEEAPFHVYMYVLKRRSILMVFFQITVIFFDIKTWQVVVFISFFCNIESETVNFLYSASCTWNGSYLIILLFL